MRSRTSQLCTVRNSVLITRWAHTAQTATSWKITHFWLCLFTTMVLSQTTLSSLTLLGWLFARCAFSWPRAMRPVLVWLRWRSLQLRPWFEKQLRHVVGDVPEVRRSDKDTHGLCSLCAFREAQPPTRISRVFGAGRVGSPVLTRAGSRVSHGPSHCTPGRMERLICYGQPPHWPKLCGSLQMYVNSKANSCRHVRPCCP